LAAWPIPKGELVRPRRLWVWAGGRRFYLVAWRPTPGRPHRVNDWSGPPVYHLGLASPTVEPGWPV